MSTKLKPFFLSSTIAVGMLFMLRPVVAANSSTTPDSVPTHDAFERDRAANGEMVALGTMQRSSRWIRLTVRDPGNNKLGKIKDIIVDLNSSRVICALVAASGSGSEYLVPIPIESFRGADNYNAVLNKPMANLKRAPRYMSTLPDPAILVHCINDSYNYFDEKPFVSKPGQHFLSKFSQLQGRPVLNKDGEELGTVVNLVIDAPMERIVFVVVSLDGKGGKLYAVPPSALAIQETSPLVLDVGKTRVTEIAGLSPYFWGDMADPAWVAADYRRFGRDLEFDTGHGQDATRENVRARIENLPQGTPDISSTASQTDSQVTQEILLAIIRDDANNNYPFRTFRIVTVNGKVTLRGEVLSEEQKQRLSILAATIVGQGSVDNQLKVR